MTEELRDILMQGSVSAAEQLIGWRVFVKEADGNLVGGAIVETEAYSQEDAASHTFNGETARNGTMFKEAGHVYVYFTYGMHWCMNFVTGPAGHGQGVLIRAIRPEAGIDIMRSRRGGKPYRQLTDGPAKVCQALGVSGADNGAVIGGDKFVVQPPVGDTELTVLPTERIGIKKDTHRLWRFIATDE